MTSDTPDTFHDIVHRALRYDDRSLGLIASLADIPYDHIVSFKFRGIVLFPNHLKALAKVLGVPEDQS